MLILFGVFVGYKIFVSPKKSIKEWKLPDPSGNGVKFITEESLINDIKEVNKIIPLELELSETITVDDSWGYWEVFKKYKKITYVADCSYSVNLAELDSSNIIMDPNKKELSIKIPKPEIYSVNINHDKTIFQEAVTGLLRFGDLTLSSEEYSIIEREIKKSISNKMNEKELYDKACDSSKEAMKNILNNILGKDLNSNISFL